MTGEGSYGDRRSKSPKLSEVKREPLFSALADPETKENATVTPCLPDPRCPTWTGPTPPDRTTTGTSDHEVTSGSNTLRRIDEL